MARFMRSCGASLMGMEGTANGGGYEKEACARSERIRERWSLGRGWSRIFFCCVGD
jgi:hypothetical protein